MPPVERAASFQNRDKQLFRVLVTGFGSFQSITENPSHLLARELDGCFFETENYAVVISAYLPPVLVDYEAVTSLVPTLHDFSWDLLLHIGIGVGNELKLEAKAHKSGYKVNSVLGKTPENGCVPVPQDMPEELLSSLPLNDIISSLAQDTTPNVAISDNAGHFLCDFIFYTSLAEEAIRRTGRAVQFLHLPSLPKTSPARSSASISNEKPNASEPLDGLTKALEVTDPLGEEYPFDGIVARTKEIIWQIANKRCLPISEPLSPTGTVL